MPQLRFDTVIVRFGGEIGIKADWTRKLYERHLITNIKAVLKEQSIPHTALVRKFGRLYIKTMQAEKATEKLSRVFGISSLSPALETTSNLNDITNLGTRLAASTFRKGKTFAVRCHRIGTHPYASQDVCRQVGYNLITKLPQLKLKVNLNHPEQTLHIEVREDKAYLFTNITKTAGGLPLGTQPKLICLLKDDTSSAVACWMTMKRGCPPILVHFKDHAPTDKTSLQTVIETAKALMQWSTGYPRRLYVVEQQLDFRTITPKPPPELSSLVCKRLMLRTAQEIARVKNAEGIVAGDTLGEKTNQTLHTLRIQDEPVKDYPIYRPLLGLDTNETQETAEKINLKKTKTPPHKTETQTIKNQQAAQTAAINLEDIKRIENTLNLEKITEKALKSLKALNI